MGYQWCFHIEDLNLNNELMGLHNPAALEPQEALERVALISFTKAWHVWGRGELVSKMIHMEEGFVGKTGLNKPL